MEFGLSEESIQVRDMVREYAEERIKPVMMEHDENQTIPMDIVKELGEMGMLGVFFPEKYGGAGMSYQDYAIVVEELSRVDGSIGIIVAAHNSLCTNHIYSAGSEEQKMEFLPDLCQGKYLGAWGLTEPGCGSDAGAMTSTAVKDGDDWILNGTKNFITNATVAGRSVVMAVSDKEKGKKGITAFVVDRDTPGFSPGKKENKLGLRASDTAELVMADCRVPDSRRIGDEGMGFIDSMKMLDGGRIGIASLGLGMAQGAFECALKYAKEREAFGQPIANFQAIQWKLADMATEIDAARLLVYQAAYHADQGKPNNKYSAMAKLYSSEVAVRCADEAVQILGGYGYIKEYPAEKYYRDAKLCTIGEGTSEIQRMVIARNVLSEFGAKL